MAQLTTERAECISPPLVAKMQYTSTVYKEWAQKLVSMVAEEDFSGQH